MSFLNYVNEVTIFMNLNLTHALTLPFFCRNQKSKMDEDDDNMIDVDVYQHPERLNIKVEVSLTV